MARKVVSLILVFSAFYLGAHFWIRSRHTVTDDVTKVSRLIDCHPSEVRGVRITQREAGGPRELVFERQDLPEAGLPQSVQLARSVWAYRAPFPGEADSVLLKRMASVFCELYDPEPVRGSDLPAGGAGERRVARMEVRLERGGNTETHLLDFSTGPESQTSSLLAYQRPGGERGLFRIPAFLARIASLPPEDYRNLKVVRLEADNVSAATLKVAGRERFTIERNGAGWGVRRSGRELGQASAEAGKFVNRLASLRGIKVEDPAFSGVKCGSETASTVVELHGVAGRGETVRFQRAADGNLSACSTAGTMRFKVHKDMARYLDLDARALIPSRN